MYLEMYDTKGNKPETERGLSYMDDMQDLKQMTQINLHVEQKKTSQTEKKLGVTNVGREGMD